MAQTAMKIIVTLALLGLGVGIIGGMVGRDAWFQGGGIVFFVSVLILFVHVWWKRAETMLDLDADEHDEGSTSINVARAESELHRKNRGTVPTAR
jgi:hypothetical protein